MYTKGAKLVFTSLLLIFSGEALAQGEISINQDFRKPAEEGASIAPSYAAYPFSEESSEAPESREVAEEAQPSGPVVDPPIPLEVEQPSVAEPVIPPGLPLNQKFVGPEANVVPAPSISHNESNVYEEQPSAVAIPLASKPIVGPPPVSQQSRFPSTPFAKAKPAPQVPAPTEVRIPTLTALRGFSWRLSREQIKYKFGRNHPTFGGLDSSGAVQFLLKETGLTGVPRTTNGLNSWARDKGALHEYRTRPSVSDLTNTLEPGNLIFWGDLESRKLNHVMIYMGFDVQRGHLAYGTRGGTEIGINNSEVDIFQLHLDRERIISTGKVPGLIRR